MERGATTKKMTPHSKVVKPIPTGKRKYKKRERIPINLKDKVLLTVRDLSDLTGYSICTLNNHRTLKVGFPFIKVGHSVRYRMVDISQYLEALKATYAEGAEPLPPKKE